MDAQTRAPSRASLWLAAVAAVAAVVLGVMGARGIATAATDADWPSTEGRVRAVELGQRENHARGEPPRADARHCAWRNHRALSATVDAPAAFQWASELDVAVDGATFSRRSKEKVEPTPSRLTTFN